MGKAVGHHWRLSCRSDDECTWSTDVVVPANVDAHTHLLVVLRAHADKSLHGRMIEGTAVGIDSDVAILVLRHP